MADVNEEDDSSYEDDAAAGDEEDEEHEEGNAWESPPSAEDLRSRWTAECRVVKALEKVEWDIGQGQSAALYAAQRARDRAEQAWRSAIAPKPVAVRMGTAQRKLNKAQWAVDKAQAALQDFEEEAERRKEELRVKDNRSWMTFTRKPANSRRLAPRAAMAVRQRHQARRDSSTWSCGRSRRWSSHWKRAQRLAAAPICSWQRSQRRPNPRALLAASSTTLEPMGSSHMMRRAVTRWSHARDATHRSRMGRLRRDANPNGTKLPTAGGTSTRLTWARMQAPLGQRGRPLRLPARPTQAQPARGPQPFPGTNLQCAEGPVYIGGQHHGLSHG